MTLEVRGGLPVEIRAKDDGTLKVSGYAAVFEEEADIGGAFREVVARGAFTNAIGRDDVVFLVNHEGLPLARTRSGTLTLREDDRGLWMETELDADDPDVRAIASKMKRGDLDKMSFAFYPRRQQWDDGQDPPLRTLLEVELVDVSIVTTPAYQGTEIALRAMENATRTKNYRQAARRLARKVSLDLAERNRSKA